VHLEFSVFLFCNELLLGPHHKGFQTFDIFKIQVWTPLDGIVENFPFGSPLESFGLQEYNFAQSIWDKT
jgi:hypothetical protein